MKKTSWILLFILGFFIVFALSAIITFTVTLDNDKEEAHETVTEAVLSNEAGAVQAAGSELDAETAVTRVTPALNVSDSIIVKTFYGEKTEDVAATYEMPEADVVIENEALAEDEEEAEEKAEEKKEETPASEVKKEETKAETKTETKAETAKNEEKKEEVKSEAKVEEKVEETPVAEPPKTEEKIEEKAEEKVEEPKVVLDPNKQYSDTGL